MKSKLFYNGNIITMEEKNKFPEAVFVEDNKIKKVGRKKELEKYLQKDTEKIDLKGNTLLPGFIDSHSHIVAFAETLKLVDLRNCKSIYEIKELLKEKKKKTNTKKWIIGYGYDQDLFQEKRHPNKLDLDKVSKENPILISHISGHMGVTNTQGLKQMNIEENAKDPIGGLFGRNPKTGELNGYMEENAFTSYAKEIEKVTIEEFMELLEEAQQIYIDNGITMAQEGLAKKEEFELLKQVSNKNKFKLDIVSYIDVREKENVLSENKQYVKRYKNRLKIGGYKMILDGSPQARTAWLTSPYEGEKDYRGYPAKTNEEVNYWVEECCNKKIQILAHCNGDAAADQFISIFKKQNIENIKQIRPVMIHSQIIQEKQIKEMSKLNIIPSFFVTHCYYWGDVHIKNLGWERAKNISSVKTAKSMELKYTFHQDTPVLPPNMLETIWCAVNRVTKEGKKLGEEQEIDVYSALQAITINAAYQYFEEETKGSIKEGKIANLVVLDKNPLQIDKKEIKDINVIATYIDGEQKKNC